MFKFVSEFFNFILQKAEKNKLYTVKNMKAKESCKML